MLKEEDTITAEAVDSAVERLEERLSDDRDLWPRATPSGKYPPETAKADLINWVRTGDRNAYRGFRARVRYAIINRDAWLVDQFRSFLQLEQTFVDRVYDTHHADGYDPTLRDDFIRHLLTLV